MGKFPISEIFCSLQGEGSFTGNKVIFIRTIGCPVMCSWCDSRYTWTDNDAVMMDEHEILDKVRELHAPIAVITGGEPLVHNLGNLVEHLFLQVHEVHLETSAFIYQDWAMDASFLSLSPKREHLNLKVLDKLTRVGRDRCLLKVVVFNDEDYKFAKEIHQRYPHILTIFQVGWPTDDKGRWLAERVVADDDLKNMNVRVLPQVHKLWWGEKRGV